MLIIGIYILLILQYANIKLLNFNDLFYLFSEVLLILHSLIITNLFFANSNTDKIIKYFYLSNVLKMCVIEIDNDENMIHLGRLNFNLHAY